MRFEDAEHLEAIGKALVTNVEKVIVGKHDVVEMAVVCLLSEGHLLIEDVPGVGKTSLAKALAKSIDGTFGRIQFTPDLLPSDIIGVNIWNRGSGAFTFRPGPVFANIVVADELNRASPKTQSALLEAMAERQVTLDGTTHVLETPFMVLATENPVEHEGTYPLPESQLDRFCCRVSIGYPAIDDEIELLSGDIGSEHLGELDPVISLGDLARLCSSIGQIEVAPTLRAYLVELARATREHPSVRLGMSPRATLALQHVARTYAGMNGQSYVTPDDVRDVLDAVVAHRLVLTPDARMHGLTGAQVLSEIVGRLSVPSSANAF